jgi:pimeloyl-ACP methyl ester carboxylesterase
MAGKFSLVAGAALSLRALMRHRATASVPVPTPNLQLRVPGFPVLERITGGVDPAQPMPLVLVLHGIGGSEEQLVPYTNLKVPARLVYVRGPVPNGTERGRQLLQGPFHRRGIHGRGRGHGGADRLRRRQRAVTRTLVLGYSQGGHVAWLLAASGRFDVVLPVSGALAPGYQPPPPHGHHDDLGAPRRG